MKSVVKTSVIDTLQKYSKSLDLNKFGGRLRYSKLQQVIDNTDTSITSNITKVTIRRDLKSILNSFVQYELCFGNRFHVDFDGKNIKSTGFKIFGESSTVYITDFPNFTEDNKILDTGIVSIFIFGNFLDFDRLVLERSLVGNIDGRVMGAALIVGWRCVGIYDKG